MDGFKLLETIGLELDLPVISKLSPQMITKDRQLVVPDLLNHQPDQDYHHLNRRLQNSGLRHTQATNSSQQANSSLNL